MSAAFGRDFHFRQRRERAVVWDSLGFDEIAIGALLVDMNRGEERWKGTVELTRVRFFRAGGCLPHQRRRLLAAFARLEELGLLFEREGHVYLLHSEWAHAMYASLAPEKRPEVGTSESAPAAENVQEACRERAGNVQEARKLEKPSTRNSSTPPPPKSRGEENRSPPTEEEPAPLKKARSPRKPKDERRELWDRVLAEAPKRHGVIPGKLGREALAEALAKAADLAELWGVDLEAAMRALVDGACESFRRGRSTAFRWGLRDWQPPANGPVASTFGPVGADGYTDFDRQFVRRLEDFDDELEGSCTSAA